MSEQTEDAVGYLVVFDMDGVGDDSLASNDPFPSRFHTKEEAVAAVERFRNWDRKSNYSVFDGSIPPLIPNPDRVNPEWLKARWEVRAVPAAAMKSMKQ